MKDSFWFQHDSNARTDARILELRAEMGWEGYGLWWAVVEHLREATDYRLSNEQIGGLAMGLSLSKDSLRQFLAMCFDLGLLELEKGHFFSPSLRRRMERWDTKRTALSEAGKRGAGKRWAGDKPDDSHPNSQAIATPLATPIAIREENIIEQNVGGKRAPADLLALKAEKAKREQSVAAHTDPDYLQSVDESPLVKPASFAAILKATGYPDLDVERYALQIAAKSEGVRRTASQWRSRIIEFVNNDYTAGRLLTYPKQTPNDIPSNWDVNRQGPYVLAPASLGIPNISSMLKPEFQVK